MFAFSLLLTAVAGTTWAAPVDSTELKPEPHFKVEGYLDLFYSVSSNTSKAGTIPYFVSSARINRLAVNKVFLALRYNGDRFRSAFIPAVGTYMTDNYVLEKGLARYLVEANAGIKLSKQKEVWLDAGVMESPFTNESAISGNQWMYTRSFAPEYVPYYLTGLRLSMPLSSKTGMRLWLLNGWQQIIDQNNHPAFAVGLDWRPSQEVDVVSNFFLGDERSALRPEFRTRFLKDLYITWRPRKHFRIATCLYYGVQQRVGGSGANWFQANLTARQRIAEGIQLAVRAEYFHDPDMVMITALNADGFRGGSIGTCLDVRLFHKTTFRMDLRRFSSPQAIFPEDKSGFRRGETRMFFNITSRF
ncbi:MAG: outer membrane beta-barrel protein [Bacteroidota bacterium]